MQLDEALDIVRAEIARQRQIKVAQVRIYEHEIYSNARRDAVGRASKHDVEVLLDAIRQLCRKSSQSDMFYVPMMNATDTTRGEAYHTGYEAHAQGEARTANPYPSGSWDADEWDAGWDAAAE